MLSRSEIFAKSNGHCWYCGQKIDLTGCWHIDHVKPVFRSAGVPAHRERECDENRVPACAPCNLFKGVYSVEGFREEISKQVDRAAKSSVNFRTAQRFGLVKRTGHPVRFWFETNTPQEQRDE